MPSYGRSLAAAATTAAAAAAMATEGAAMEVSVAAAVEAAARAAAARVVAARARPGSSGARRRTMRENPALKRDAPIAISLRVLVFWLPDLESREIEPRRTRGFAGGRSEKSPDMPPASPRITWCKKRVQRVSGEGRTKGVLLACVPVPEEQKGTCPGAGPRPRRARARRSAMPQTLPTDLRRGETSRYPPA